MFQIDSMSRQPVYEQIIQQTEWLVLSHALTSGDQMPSVRSLSIELSVNPNTIQKAYSELDLRGIIYSVPGIGSFVSEDALKKISILKRKNLEDLEFLLKELSLSGVEEEEIINLTKRIYKSNQNIKNRGEHI